DVGYELEGRGVVGSDRDVDRDRCRAADTQREGRRLAELQSTGSRDVDCADERLLEIGTEHQAVEGGRVGHGTAVEDGRCSAPDDVDAGASAYRIVAGAAVQGVIATAGSDRVVAVLTVDQVAAVSRGDGVVAGGSVNDIVAAAGADPVVAGVAVD